MSDLDILARTLYGEARDEGDEGLEAIACVVMNRFKSGKWFTGYIWQDGHKVPSLAQTCLKRFQFNCWNRSDPNFKIIQKVNAKDEIFRRCLLIANQAIAGELEDFTNGAVYYHTRDLKPYWAKHKSPCYEVGRHLFYRME